MAASTSNVDIDAQKKDSTEKNTKSHLKHFSEWLLSRKYDNRQVDDISPEILNEYLAEYFITVTKYDGSDYEPSTLDNIKASVERYLRDNSYPFSLSTDRIFSKARSALKAKKNSLKKKGFGQKSTASEMITKEDEQLLRKHEQLGIGTPHSLQFSVFYYFTKGFGLRGRDEHRRMRFGDVSIKITSDGVQYLELSERASRATMETTPKIFSVSKSTEDDPVEIFKLFCKRRPKEALDPESPMYLSPKPLQRLVLCYECEWYYKNPMGVNTLGSLIKEACKNAGVKGKKTNHSLRKSTVAELSSAGVPPHKIIKITGHQNVQALQYYDKELNMNEHQNISGILCQPLKQKLLLTQPHISAKSTTTDNSNTSMYSADRNTDDVTFNHPKNVSTRPIKSTFSTDPIDSGVGHVCPNTAEQDSNDLLLLQMGQEKPQEKKPKLEEEYLPVSFEKDPQNSNYYKSKKCFELVLELKRILNVMCRQSDFSTWIKITGTLEFTIDTNDIVYCKTDEFIVPDKFSSSDASCSRLDETSIDRSVFKPSAVYPPSAGTLFQSKESHFPLAASHFPSAESNSLTSHSPSANIQLPSTNIHLPSVIQSPSVNQTSFPIKDTQTKEKTCHRKDFVVVESETLEEAVDLHTGNISSQSLYQSGMRVPPDKPFGDPSSFSDVPQPFCKASSKEKVSDISNLPTENDGVFIKQECAECEEHSNVEDSSIKNELTAIDDPELILPGAELVNRVKEEPP